MVKFRLHSRMKLPFAARLRPLEFNLSRITAGEKVSGFENGKRQKDDENWGSVWSRQVLGVQRRR
jgi:hypothetical protein